MDYFKKMMGGNSEHFDITMVPTAVTLAPPPAVPVQVYVQIQREAKHNFTSKKYRLDPGAPGSKKKLALMGEGLQMTNEYRFKKGKSANMPGSWEQKDVLVTVMCEGQGGKVQVIASQKVNISEYVNTYFTTQ